MEILNKDTAKLLRDDAVRDAVHKVLDGRHSGGRSASKVVVRINSDGKKSVSVREAQS